MADPILPDIDRVLIPRDRIAQRVAELAVDIAGHYQHQEAGLTLVPILSGSLIFLADLIRQLPMKMKIGLMTVSSYTGASTKGRPAVVLKDLTLDIEGQNVLVIDDILDTGNTLRLVIRELATRCPNTLKSCVLLRKPAKAPPDLNPDFVGFDIEDAFVVGYGLDYDNHYRNYPDIGILKPELYRS